MSASPFVERIAITATLRVQTPLHVGTGRQFRDQDIPEIEGAKQGEEHPFCAEIAADGDGKPYLPGSGLKGALRALLESALAGDAHRADPLFGEIKDEGSGRMSPLIVYGAKFVNEGAGSDRPLAAKKKHGKAVSARTAIDRKRGAADRHKLFHAEEVTRGATFRFEALFLPGYAKDARAARQQLEMLLFLLQERGLAAGRATRAGHGRLAIDGDFNATGLSLKEDGDLRSTPAKGLDGVTLRANHANALGKAALGVRKSYALTLSGEGPFFVNDWSWQPDKSKDKQAKSAPQREALRESRQEPILPGPSVLGAMRARARWLAALARLRKDAADPFYAEREPGADEDVPVVAELFGTTERRGLLGVDALEVEGIVERGRMTSVRLDRFSGAPMDSALFAVESFIAPVFKLTLQLHKPAAESQERAVATLFDDLRRNGLRLGHAGNRGFGWFVVAYQEA